MNIRSRIRLAGAGGALLLLLPLLLPLSGCRSRPQVEVNGLFYDALTPAEEQELVVIARSAILRAKKALLPGEDVLIRNSAPKIKIIYYHNCYGNALISWEAPTRRITVQFTGSLLSSTMHMQLYTVRNSNEIIDFSNRRHSFKTVPASSLPQPIYHKDRKK